MLPDMSRYESGVLNPVVNRNTQRAYWHDYRSRCIYMITLVKMKGIPVFSHITGRVTGKKIEAAAELTAFGHQVEEALKGIPVVFPEIKLYQYSIMPDHLHVLLEVRERSPHHIGNIVKVFKDNCGKRYKEILLRDYQFVFEGRIFENGYNDRILFEKGQLNILYEYIRDNPRRLYLKQNFPQYFRNVLMCLSGKGEYSVYGNICLMEHPQKAVVRFSRRFSAEEMRRKQSRWMETVRSGGVLVSPFIHPEENKMLKYALENGGRVIIVKDNAFPEKWKPSKSFIDATSEGRVLFVGPGEYSSAKIEMKRALAMRLNKISEDIALLRRGDFSLAKR